MQKQDKTMVRTWVMTPVRIARELRGLMDTHHKDKELVRALELAAGDLEYGNADILDTLDRL